jgi:hypothetical protein
MRSIDRAGKQENRECAISCLLSRSCRTDRYPSQQQHSESNREKGERFLEKAKWLALLPLALRAIHIVAEPSGGWEQYFQGDEKMSKAPRPRK